MKDLSTILEDRKIVLAREITKIHEEFIRGDIDFLIEKSKEIKGEIVLIIEANNKKEENKLLDFSLEEHYKYYENQGL